MEYCTVSIVSFERRDFYYDLHVPGYESYLADGVWNHNSGKSTLLATFPRPLMIVSALGENMAPYAGLNDVVINIIEDWDQMGETFSFLRSEKSPFKAVGFDTLTRLMGFYLDKRTGLKRGGVELGEYLTKGKPKTQRDWGVWEDLGFMSVQTVNDFNQLPLHTVYLCQETTDRPKNEDDILQTFPTLSPASWKGVKDIVHMVGRLYVTEASGGISVATETRSINPNRKDQRNLLIGQHDRYFTKGPTHLLGYVIPNPSWDVLAQSLPEL